MLSKIIAPAALAQRLLYHLLPSYWTSRFPKAKRKSVCTTTMLLRSQFLVIYLPDSMFARRISLS
jgi:hypothetical protein